MKHRYDLTDLTVFLHEQNIHLNKYQFNRLERHLDLIKSWSNRANLISREDLDNIVEKHVLPCFMLYAMIQPSKGRSMLDIGSGAGFPGIILKIVQPDLKIDLIDSANKKYLFLTEVNLSLSLKCRVLHQRVDSLKMEKVDKFDYIVSRGVANLETLWCWSKDLLKPKANLFALKGGDLEEELGLLEKRGIYTKILRPGEPWITFSQYLKDKFVIKVENTHV